LGVQACFAGAGGFLVTIKKVAGYAMNARPAGQNALKKAENGGKMRE
jgi:hypothetical protein